MPKFDEPNKYTLNSIEAQHIFTRELSAAGFKNIEGSVCRTTAGHAMRFELKTLNELNLSEKALNFDFRSIIRMTTPRVGSGH